MSAEGDMERARAVATEGRALPAGTWGRVPVAGPAAARLAERLLRPFAARQREATADLVRAVDALRARVEAVEGALAPPSAPPTPSPASASASPDLDPLRRDLIALRAELGDLRALLEGHARRATGEGAALASALRRATERIDALEAGAPGTDTDPWP